MSNNFDKIAPIYNLLAFLVFGRALHKSQIHHFGILKPNQKVLIAGGGTGKILHALDNLKYPLLIDYIEKSIAMIDRAKKKAPFMYIKVEFINKDIGEMDLPNYDVVITNFFLDVFPSEQLLQVMKKLAASLKAGGNWILTDFRQTDIWWQSILLKFMHRFFKVTAHLEASQLADFDSHFKMLGFLKKDSKLFYKNMIESAIFKSTIKKDLPTVK